MHSPEGLDWQAAWRALAEKELRGAPFTSLTASRHDGLVIEPALGPDALRDEGLGEAAGGRELWVVARRVEDVGLAAHADGVWWHSHVAPPDGAPVRLVETGTHTNVVEALVRGDDGIVRQSVVALTDVHESGGSAVTEVAVGVAAVIELAHRRGGAPADFRLAVSVGPELFVEIAKLRALRRVARRVLARLGLSSPIWIAARSAQRSLARLDVPTNVVRATLGAAASMLGGADAIGVVPMDADADVPTAGAARLARNTAQILARESGLLAVDDPARGSFEIEALTDRIARDAWEVVREIERTGGLVASRQLVRARIERDAEARRRAVRSRRISLVGVSKFPLGTDRAPEVGYDDGRDAFVFEQARAGASVAVELVSIGDSMARVEFVRDVLEVLGLEVAAAGEGRVAVVCAPDAAFETEVPTALGALAARGVPAFVAGKPGPAEPALRAAGARGFVALGSDLSAFGAELRRAVGGAS